MNDIYRKHGESLTSYEQAFAYPTGAVGMVVALNGRMAGADIFDQPRTASALWPKLVRSYAMDALNGSRGEAVEHSRAVRLLARVSDARFETYPSLALGEDVRFEGGGVAGSSLVFAATPIHTSLFRVRHSSNQAFGDTRIARSSARGWFRGRPVDPL